MFKNLSVRYRPELDYALIDVNAEIGSGEKVKTQFSIFTLF
jgi:hypothetical protein